MIIESEPHHSINADLPHASHAVSMPGASREDAMKIYIMRDGSTYFRSDKVAPSQLQSRIADYLQDRAVEHKVYIAADARVRYAAVKQVLDGLRAAGIERVAFLASQRRLASLAP
jgi:biopolymer transport protein ExbD